MDLGKALRQSTLALAQTRGEDCSARSILGAGLGVGLRRHSNGRAVLPA